MIIVKFTVEFDQDIAAEKEGNNRSYGEEATPFVIHVATDYKDFRYNIKWSVEYQLLYIFHGACEYDCDLGGECTVVYTTELDKLLNHAGISKINDYLLEFSQTKSSRYPRLEIQEKEIRPFFYEVVEKEIINDQKANAAKTFV